MYVYILHRRWRTLSHPQSVCVFERNVERSRLPRVLNGSADDGGDNDDKSHARGADRKRCDAMCGVDGGGRGKRGVVRATRLENRDPRNRNGRSSARRIRMNGSCLPSCRVRVVNGVNGRTPPRRQGAACWWRRMRSTLAFIDDALVQVEWWWFVVGSVVCLWCLYLCRYYMMERR